MWREQVLGRGRSAGTAGSVGSVDIARSVDRGGRAGSLNSGRARGRGRRAGSEGRVSRAGVNNNCDQDEAFQKSNPTIYDQLESERFAFRIESEDWELQRLASRLRQMTSIDDLRSKLKEVSDEFRECEGAAKSLRKDMESQMNRLNTLDTIVYHLAEKLEALLDIQTPSA